ncbi:MAG: hypothetical protein ACJ79S_01820 [Gemmatimonadaceae bacterium]
MRSCALTATLAATVAAVGAPSRASPRAGALQDTSDHAPAPTRAPTGSVHDFDYHVTTFHGRHGFGNISINRVPS